MSIESIRSSRNGGSGTIMSITIASAATGATRYVARAGVLVLVFGESMGVTLRAASQHQLLDSNQVREHFGDRAEEIRRNRVADFRALVQRARERGVFDDRDAVLACDVANPLRDEIAAFRHDDRRGILFP